MKAILTKYHPAGLQLAARYSASCEGFKRMYFSYELIAGAPGEEKHRNVAKQFCVGNQITGKFVTGVIAIGGTEHYVHVFTS